MNLKECIKCPLHETRTNVVISRGGHKSGVFFVGEAPGKNEDLSGIPFVGKAGTCLSVNLKKHLTNGIIEEDFYITNAVKCRPPDNRDPTQEELDACADWLDRQISRFKPWLIVSLGAQATKRLTGDATLGRRVGTIEWSKQYDCGILITYHPSYIARGNPNGIDAWERDFAWLNAAINSPQWYWHQINLEVKTNGRMAVGLE